MATQRSELRMNPEENFKDFFTRHLEDILQQYKDGNLTACSADYIQYKIDLLLPIVVQGSLLNYLENDIADLHTSWTCFASRAPVSKN